MNDATNGKPAFFANEDELHRFGSLVLVTYGSTLHAIELAALAAGGGDRATLIARLVIRMLHYKATQAAARAPSFDLKLEAQLEELWPVFKAQVDADLEEAQLLLDNAKAEALKKAQ